MKRIHSPSVRAEIDHQMREAIKAAEAELMPGFGITLFAYPVEQEDGRLFYISNSRRADVVRLLELWIEKQKRGR